MSGSLKKQLTEFMDFVKEKGVVGLAVGLAIGTQVGVTVTAIVKGLINPLVNFLVGNTKGLESATWTIVEIGSHKLVIGWGLILSAFITLMGVIIVLFYGVKLLRVDTSRLKKRSTKKPEKPAGVPEDKIEKKKQITSKGK